MVKNRGQEEPKYTLREVAEAVLQAGLPPQQIIESLERGRETPYRPQPVDGKTATLFADEEGVVEVPYARLDSNHRSARVEHHTTREKQAILLMNLNPRERVEITIPDKIVAAMD